VDRDAADRSVMRPENPEAITPEMRNNIAKWLLQRGDTRAMLQQCSDDAFYADIRGRCVDLYNRRFEIMEAEREAKMRRAERLSRLGLKGVQTAMRCPECRQVFVDHAACIRHATDTHGSVAEPVLVKLVDSEWIEVIEDAA